jgi:hypothetical protein
MYNKKTEIIKLNIITLFYNNYFKLNKNFLFEN